MKRKNQTVEQLQTAEVVPVQPEVLAAASKVYVVEERPVMLVPCVVCAAETDSREEEKLCWVCRRLKISAWRDSELVPAQE